MRPGLAICKVTLHDAPELATIMEMVSKRSRFQTVAFPILTYGIALHGLIMIATTLEEQLHLRFTRHLLHVSGFVFDVPILLGLTLLYLSTLLRRRKRTAWYVTTALYAFILVFSVVQFGLLHNVIHHPLLALARNVLLPLIAVAGLFTIRKLFTVKSDLRSFGFSLRFIALVLGVTLVYGVSGFLVMDNRDFHQEFSFPGAIQRTVDQFNITTNTSLHPYTRRAKLFVDSLSVISAGAVVYAAISLFQPIRARLHDESRQRELAEAILERHRGSSEDFFKLWPHDKLYFFNLTHGAGIAYGVHRGVALVVGDPFGDPQAFPKLLVDFDEYCRTNDWAIAFIHTEPQYVDLYKQDDFSLQKIGEEAVLDIAHFEQNVKGNKYFRQIRNKFAKQDYTTEVLQPPHNQAVMQRLHAISDDWLKQPGRDERRFLLGYFHTDYLQQCPVMILRDAAGTIQAFINQVRSFDSEEANYDLLRHTKDALGNANDYLLMQFIAYAQTQGFKRVNLGLCPLAGLDARDQERSVVDSALRFVYANGDRLYSFSGLHRFKAKYEPHWSSRYIAYRGGIRGFTRVLNALNRAMRV
jgi:phosphatidylglycerol lysyltransferase